MNAYEFDPCDKCEQMMQPFLDKVLTDQERVEAEEHLATCSYCARRYRFEERLRVFVRESVVETMSPALKQKLRDLRTPL